MFFGGRGRFQVHRNSGSETCCISSSPPSPLIQRLETETRLTYANPVGRVDVFGGEAPSAGIHWLQKNEVVYKQVSATVRAALVPISSLIGAVALLSGFTSVKCRH